MAGVDAAETAGVMPVIDRIFRKFMKIDIVKHEICFIILLVKLILKMHSIGQTK